jgi:RHS repeat-associated protein
MRATRVLFSLLALTPCITAIARAQAPTGIPPFGTFSKDFVDTLNLGTLNEHFELPIRKTPGRGLGFQAALDFDTTLHLDTTSPSGAVWAGDSNPTFNTSTDGRLISTWSNVQCPYPSTSYTQHYTNFVFWDIHNTPHSFGNVNIDTANCLYGAQLWSPAVDGSNYFLTLTRQGQSFTSTVNDASGTVYNPFAITDSNGNTVSGGSGRYAQWVDSSGNTVLTNLGTQNPQAYTYVGPGASTETVQINYGTFTRTTNFGCLNAEASPGTVQYVTSVNLPDGSSYHFSYEPTPGATQPDPNNPTILTGRIKTITLPTGGTITYNYTGTHNGISCEDGGVSGFTKTTPDGTWTYSRSYNTSTTIWTTTTTDPQGNQTVYNFSGPFLPGYVAASFETQRIVYQLVNGVQAQVLQTVTCYNGNFTNCATARIPYALSQKDVYTYLPGLAQPSLSETKYDSYSNLIEVKDYDFGAAFPPGNNYVRDRLIVYGTYSNGTCTAISSTIVNRPCTDTTKNSAGTILRQSTFSYDAYGNLLTARTLAGGSTFLTSTYTYTPNGLVNTATDPNGNQTTTTYGACNGSFPTTISRPLSLSETMTWDCAGEVPTSATDANNQTTAFSYVSPTTGVGDPFWRLLKTQFPDGGQFTTAYNIAANPPNIIVSKMIDNTPRWLTTQTNVDGMGRPTADILSSDPDGAVYAQTVYDAVGRVGKTYNPTRCNPPTTNCGESTWGYTSYAYDALGRTTQVTNPDNSTVLTTYTGRAMQVQDEGNGTRRVTRVSQVDGLGRLISVCEVTSATQLGSSGTPVACGQDISATGFLTTYGYDPLDNLLSVTQNGLNQRLFNYDSLSRVTSATHPESGSTSYTYNSDTNCSAPNSFAGLLVSKVDARGIRTCMQYDALNRMTQKNYSDGTPTASFNYDQTSAYGVSLLNTTGRLTSQSTASPNPTGAVFSYDQMGRVKINSQCTPQNCGANTVFPVTYAYDLLGDMLTSTNGAGVTLTNTVNTATRLTTLTSSLSDSNHPGTLFSAAHFNAAGSILSATLGGSVSETRTYDTRLRLATIADGSNYSLTIPSSGGYAPNGSILAANDSVNGNWTYTYDDFNRLMGSNKNSGAEVYSYDYDSLGNRWHQNGTHTMMLSFSGSNNRMDGYSYDAAGNLLSDGTHSYSYDAENRLTKVDNGSTATYIYDADGQRVRKTTSSGSVDYLYDLGGHEITELSSSGSWNRGEVYASGRHLATYNNSTTYLIHTDHLGTERVRTNSSGASCETVTSLSFGDWQTTSGSCGDPSPMHFTGKERDSESGLDNFGFRYYGSSMGRFMSPDPANAGASIDTPQSWNAYSYVLNNPLKYIDPFGLDCIYLNDAGDAVDHIRSGDCKNEGGRNDAGYFVDNSEDHPVQTSDVTIEGDKMVVSFSSQNDLPGQGHYQQFCTGYCPDNSVTVSTSIGDPIPTTMSALHVGLPPANLQKYEPPVQADFWNMTPQQQGDVSACMATGGEYGGETIEPPDARQAIGYVVGSNGKPLKYPGNNKPIIPNIKGAKRTPRVTGSAGALEFVAGGLNCAARVLGNE